MEYESCEHDSNLALLNLQTHIGLCSLLGSGLEEHASLCMNFLLNNFFF